MKSFDIWQEDTWNIVRLNRLINYVKHHILEVLFECAFFGLTVTHLKLHGMLWNLKESLVNTI